MTRKWNVKRKCESEFTIRLFCFYIGYKTTSGICFGERAEWLGSHWFCFVSEGIWIAWSFTIIAGSLPHFHSYKNPWRVFDKARVHFSLLHSSFQVSSNTFSKCLLQWAFSITSACLWSSTWLWTGKISPSKELQMDHLYRLVLTWSPITTSMLRPVLHPS